MKFGQFIFLVLYISTSLCGLAYSLSCLDDEGNDVDWFVLYKLPKNRRCCDNHFIKKGVGYTYLDESGKWIMSDKGIDDTSNKFMRTINQIAKNEGDISYIIYNDEDPRTGRSSARHGHTKGVLAVDAQRGFWIIHSIPRFPTDPKESNIKYPRTGKTFGQTIMCITFDNKDLKKIVQDFVYTVPYIYAHHAGEGLENLDDNLKQFFSTDDVYADAEPPYTYVTEIVSPGGSHFKIFGKHKDWEQDLYGKLVAPTLKAPLRVDTWNRGSGGIMGSSCDLEYPVSKVDHVLVNTSSVKMEFSTKSDHSKWAATETGYEPYLCIGDINRVRSQWHRGGGTACVQNEKAWKAFHDTAADVEQCKI